MRLVSATFVNWAGNQRCAPARRISPASEVEVQAAVRDAIAAGRGVRVVATGHSFSPVHLTGGTLIDLAGFAGITLVDAAAGRVRALPGTAVGAFGEPLWDQGLALANQGDIDTQGIGGAIGTATHGSGAGLQSFSASMRSCRLVDGTGEVVVVDGSAPDLLAAAQVSIGMLGVMTEVEIEVVPRYRLAQRIEESGRSTGCSTSGTSGSRATATSRASGARRRSRARSTGSTSAAPPSAGTWCG